MQLLLILALLLFGGRDDAGKLLKEFRPVLEQFGGDDVKQALKSAEELQGVISALGSFGAAGTGGANNGTNFGTTDGKNCSRTGGNQNRRADGGNTAENKNTRTYAANNGNSYGFDGGNVKDGGTADFGKTTVAPNLIADAPLRAVKATGPHIHMRATFLSPLLRALPIKRFCIAS